MDDRKKNDGRNKFVVDEVILVLSRLTLLAIPQLSSHVFSSRVLSISLSLFLSVIISSFFAQAAHAASPIAVLKSQSNEQAYQDQHIGTFEDDFNEFKRTFAASNVRFDEIGDVQVAQGSLPQYKLIVVPLLVDIAPTAVSGLSNFVKNGGKLIITDGGGTPGTGASAIANLAGVNVQGRDTFRDPGRLVWVDSPIALGESFPVGSAVTRLATTSTDSKALAKWEGGGPSGPAIVKKDRSVFLGWAPGMQGDLMVNARFMSMILDDLAPGITQEAATQISFAEYQTIKEELDYLTKKTQEAIDTAKQAEFAVSYKVIQDNYNNALQFVQAFHDSYKGRRFLEADENLVKARNAFALAFALSMPVRPVEARSVWLDRGTIVACRNAKGMSDLFEKLKNSGINVVYFETNNAGFTMYPSAIISQNPETVGWDPLGCAVGEARKRGMEIHAWLWAFAVGNHLHNPIIGKASDWPGPVLEKYDFNWALASKTGQLMPSKQHEFWLDPSNPDCRNYIKRLVAEVTEKYEVDGIQLDYIRYPFNNKGSEEGFNWLSRVKFEQETGLNLDNLTDETREVFTAWKVHQVNQLVKETSEYIRAKHPKMRISVAVYAFPRRMRVNAIQQEWETWVANGWIDTVNPMTYANSAQLLESMADFCRESTMDKALVYPGLAVRRVDTAGLIEQMDSARATGTLGTTFFAVAHLDDARLNVLKLGPYRRQTLLTPQSQPIRASRFLMDDFSAMVNRYLQDPKTHILSDTASTNDVLNQLESVQKNMHQLTPNSTGDQIETVQKDVTRLHDTIKEWLRLEAFIQRGFRAQYIVNYLSQVEAILSYAAHKAKIDAKGNDRTMAGVRVQ